MEASESTRRLCRKLQALELYKHGYLSLDALVEEVEEKTALGNPTEAYPDHQTRETRRLKCGLCGQTVATISLTVRSFVARCIDCLP